jgi:uncharacterized protein YutE (UPF0331/DUF86 family)
VVDADLVAARLRELADRIARVRARVPSQASTFAADRDALDLVAFNLMLAVQSCLDIASHLIADEKWPPAATLGEAFERLCEQGVLDRTTAEALRRATGLRNVVAHGYSRACGCRQEAERRVPSAALPPCPPVRGHPAAWRSAAPHHGPRAPSPQGKPGRECRAAGAWAIIVPLFLMRALAA